MTPEEFRRAGHDLIDWIANYRERVERAEFPVMARTTPGALRAALPSALPLLDGRWAVRVSLGGANTEHEHVTALWRLMQQKIAI